MIITNNCFLRFTSILLIIFSASFVSAQGKYYPVNVSLWPKTLSLNKTNKDTATFNLSLLYTNIGKIKGVGIGLGYVVNNQDMSGININAGLTEIGGKLNGMSLSAIGNNNKKDIYGFQIAGFVNIAQNNIKGAQMSGLVNYLIGDLKGAQLSAVINIASSDVKGFQIGNSNITGENLTGAQIGTTFNVVSDKLNGVQVAPGNIAGENYGGQVGLLNVTGTNKGLQLGLVNIADYQLGIPVGIANIATKNGDIEWINYTSNFTLLNTGIKINAGKFVSIIEAGYDHFDSQDNQSWTLGAHYGYDFEFAKYYKISPDIGYVEIFDSKKGDTEHEFALQARVIGQIEFNKKIRFFTGIGYSHRFIINNGEDIKEGKFLVLAGFSLF
ncbi:MAG: hypothetical protein IPJ45_17285 [Ignavibacteria bacterium]|nr:hypothetical protein [Ignavibacteria bacterium]